jgi:cytochrome bd-type quinol oxidase subunit 2
MTPKIKKIYQGLVCSILLLIVISPLSCLAADAQAGITKGITDFTNASGLPKGSSDLVVVVTNVVKSLLALMGLILVILIIYAGFTWMTAQGDEKKVETAKTMIKNAAIGVILIIAAYAIATFIVTQTTTAISGSDSSGDTPAVH